MFVASTSAFEIVSAVEDLKDPYPVKAFSFVNFLSYFSREFFNLINLLKLLCRNFINFLSSIFSSGINFRKPDGSLS